MVLKLLRFLRWYYRKMYTEYSNASEISNLNYRKAKNVVIRSPHNLYTEEDVYFDYGAYIHCGDMDWCKGMGSIKIGKGSYIGPQCIIFGMGEVEIGKYVMVSPNTVISSVQHPYNDTSTPMYQQPRVYKKVIIHDDVYIASNVVVTPGVTIGKGAVIGAGAVVTKDIEPYGIAMGVPARVERFRK